MFIKLTLDNGVVKRVNTNYLASYEDYYHPLDNGTILSSIFIKDQGSFLVRHSAKEIDNIIYTGVTEPRKPTCVSKNCRKDLNHDGACLTQWPCTEEKKRMN